MTAPAEPVTNHTDAEHDPAHMSAPLPVSPGEAKPASRTAQLAAALIDSSLALAVPGLVALVTSVVSGTSRSRLGDPDMSWAADGSPMLGTPLTAAGWALLAVVLVQWLWTALAGRSLGRLVLGLAVHRDGRAPGFVRGVALRSWPVLLLAAVAGWLLAPVPESLGWPVRLVAAVPAILLLDALVALLPGSRALRDRLAGTRVVSLVDRSVRAFDPPHFSGVGLVIAAAGFALSGIAAGVIASVLGGIAALESTDLDVPALAAATVAPLGLVATGALASFRARRFLLGELALFALIAGLLAFELMSLGLLPVPAMQRFDVAGWVDWSVYSLGLYFGTVVFLVLGSALGFMVSSDRGADFSTRFERLVARRHLRLKMSHWMMLALIATLLPVVIYGVFIWPIRATVRLVRGEAVSRPLPPTVFMALLTIVGVMFGVMSLNVVLAVMGGFERDLKEKILGANAHGVVHKFVGEFTEWREVQEQIRAIPGVAGSTPFTWAEVMITTDSAVTGAVLKGIDVDTVGQVTDIAKNIDQDNGRLSDLLYPDRIPVRPPDPYDPGSATDTGEVLPGIAIGREMARSLNVWIGDPITVMNPIGELGPSGPIPRSRSFRVAAVFVTGMYEYDAKWAYVSLREAQRFFRMGDSVAGLELKFQNVDEARPLMKRVYAALGGFPYRTRDWGEMNQNLFSALRLERIVMFILLSFQVLIACICVIATLVMLVVEKRKEVATLKAMGAREGSIMKLFVLEGLIIGSIGTFYGSAAGFLFCKLIEKYGVNLDPQVYYITRLPVVIEPGAFVTVGLVAMVLVFVATIYPARRGGSIAPVEGFREE